MIRTAIAMVAMLLLGSRAPAPPPAASTLIRGARVFDGTGSPAIVADVLVTGDRIAAVGTRLRAPRNARIVEAKGMTLIPGLHDLHTHLRAPGFSAPDDLGKAYAGYLVNGVTTVNDYSLSGEMLEPIRQMTASGAVLAPHLQLAIRLGVPGGHGTEYGWGSYFTLEATTPRAAHVAMRRALAYHPDVIKVFADGWRYGRSPDLNSMNQPTLAAIVADAHAAGIPVITHTVTLGGAEVAAAGGVDAVGHGVGDAPVDARLIATMKANRTAYVPTLVVYEPQQDRAFLPEEMADLRPPERAREESRLTRAIEPIPALEAERWTIMQANVAALKAAGVPIGVGTDAGIGGVYHGSSTLREIRLLVKFGLTPREALAAATSVSAAILGQQADHGRIAAGQRADLVLIAGRPDERIDDLHHVARVWVSGREMPLVRLRTMIDGEAMSPLPVHVMPGAIDTGARSDGRTDLDTLPVDSTESGTDHSDLDLVRPDDGPGKGGAKRMFLVARMGAASRPYAQLIVPLTKGGIQLADARGFTGIAFTARGTGRYSMTFDSYGIGQPGWFRAPFDAGPTAQEVRIPFAAFASSDANAAIDLGRLRALIVRLDGAPASRQWLELGALRFYR